MKQNSNQKNEDDPQPNHDNVTKIDAEKLKEIIKNSNSIWAIAVNAYNLGRYPDTPRYT